MEFRSWLSWKSALAGLIFYSSTATLWAQIVEIKLVDGRSGRPIVGEASYVDAWVGTERKEAIAIPTDADGVARLRLTNDPGQVNIPNPTRDNGSIVVKDPIVKYDDTMAIQVPYALCMRGGSNYSWLAVQHFSTRELLEHGYVSLNTCGKATALQKPGEVVLFLRPLSWWERFKE
ncbi:MAG: hypothetical protein WBW84_18790 [Acidobacteriaceae bacterium]